MPSHWRWECRRGCHTECREIDHLEPRISRLHRQAQKQQNGERDLGPWEQWEDEGLVPDFGRVPPISELHQWGQGPWPFNPRGLSGECPADGRLWWEDVLRPARWIRMEQRQGAEETEKKLHSIQHRPCGFQPRTLWCGIGCNKAAVLGPIRIQQKRLHMRKDLKAKSSMQIPLPERSCELHIMRKPMQSDIANYIYSDNSCIETGFATRGFGLFSYVHYVTMF